MANTINSPSMSLPVPVVGVDPGPQYATDVNNCLTIIDGHNHAPGYGVQINPDGININADLAFNGNNLTTARSLRLSPQNAVLTGPADLGCLYEVTNDLYFNDGLGNNIRITQSGGVAGTPGSISNLTPPASASYSSSSQTFIFQSAASTPANIDAASYILRNLTASSHGLTLNPPNAMGSDYTITLPTLPASTLPVSISASGTMAAAVITYAQLDASLQAQISTVPTITILNTAGTGTYAPPAGVNYIRIRMAGAGGGGASVTGGNTGGDTLFGTTFLVASGGVGGTGAAGGAGGAASIGSGASGMAFSGAYGGCGSGPTSGLGSFLNEAGGSGGNSLFGVAGAGGAAANNAQNAPTNSGGGGGGAGVSVGGSGGTSSGGGGGGGFLECIVGSLAGSYTYTVGASGTGATGGTSGGNTYGNGGNGSDGIIYIEEHYGS